MVDVPLDFENPEVNKGTHLIETWAKVLITPGYTDNARNACEQLVKRCFQTISISFLLSPELQNNDRVVHATPPLNK